MIDNSTPKQGRTRTKTSRGWGFNHPVDAGVLLRKMASPFISWVLGSLL